ncbi:MAG TPA: hypothetical protein VEC60_17410, partial [Reyranella sp.]|nr:hypothetical protein [Reyranella sp.]
TESVESDRKKRLANEMSFDQRRALLDCLVGLGARSVNIVGAGEPTIDPYFFALLEHCRSIGLVPIVYTEGSLKLASRPFCERLFDLGATVVLKVNSLVNREYQNKILVSGYTKPRTPRYDYFERRKAALELLLEVGFNKSAPTRLAFDTIVCRENASEIIDLHRFARDNNIFTLMVNYLPSGRSTSGHTNSISRAEQFALFAELSQIDCDEYGIQQRGIFPYTGAQPCLIRGTGLFVKISGDVLACPGETQPIGNVLRTPLAEIWSRLADVRAAFDGGCPPRERFWNALLTETASAETVVGASA